MTRNNIIERVFLNIPIIPYEIYEQYPQAFNGLEIMEKEPHKKYPMWPEWDIPQEYYSMLNHDDNNEEETLNEETNENLNENDELDE